MYSVTIRKWIQEAEKDFNTLKSDYEKLEKEESEEMRQEVRKDINKLRKKITNIMSNVNDLIWWKK